MLEPLIGGLVYHATGRLKILKHSLQSLAENLDNCSVVEFRQVFGTLKKCIVHHNDILTWVSWNWGFNFETRMVFRFIREFENCFSWCVFCQIAATAVALCFCSIGLTLVSRFFCVYFYGWVLGFFYRYGVRYVHVKLLPHSFTIVVLLSLWNSIIRRSMKTTKYVALVVLYFVE